MPHLRPAARREHRPRHPLRALRLASCGDPLDWLRLRRRRVTLFYGGPVRDAVTSSVVTLACFPVAIVSAVLVDELSHAFAGRFLGQTVTRVLVGEGRAVVRFGRDPELCSAR